jgi:hypothetical protein
VVAGNQVAAGGDRAIKLWDPTPLIFNRMATPYSTRLPAVFDSVSVRVVVALVGIVLFAFFAILFFAAFVNLPDSWIGVIYSAYGLTAGICAFRYAYAPKRILLFVFVPALLMVLVTLSGVVP